jgi:hypothetical protein
MLRIKLLGLLTVLAVAGAGLVPAGAQTGGKPVPANELKRVQAFQDKFNKAVDTILEKARSSGKKGKVIISTTLSFDIISTKAIKLDKLTFTAEQVQTLKGEVNKRLDAALKAGKLTELDRRLIEHKNLTEVQKTLKK